MSTVRTAAHHPRQNVARFHVTSSQTSLTRRQEKRRCRSFFESTPEVSTDHARVTATSVCNTSTAMCFLPLSLSLSGLLCPVTPRDYRAAFGAQKIRCFRRFREKHSAVPQVVVRMSLRGDQKARDSRGTTTHLPRRLVQPAKRSSSRKKGCSEGCVVCRAKGGQS